MNNFLLQLGKRHHRSCVQQFAAAAGGVAAAVAALFGAARGVLGFFLLVRSSETNAENMKGMS